MSKSTNMVVYFDSKTVIYIYVCRKCRAQFMLPMEKSVTFTGACANEIIPSINHLFVYKPKEGSHVRIILLNFIFHLHIICYTDDYWDRRDRMIYIVYWDQDFVSGLDWHELTASLYWCKQHDWPDTVLYQHTIHVMGIYLGQTM